MSCVTSRASLLSGIFTSTAATIQQESNDYSSTRQPKQHQSPDNAVPLHRDYEIGVCLRKLFNLRHLRVPVVEALPSASKDRQSHWYALPLAVEPMYPVVCVQTTCVAPMEAAFSRASFLAFSIPVLAAMFPKPDEPSTSDTNLQRVTCESSATWTRCAAGLNVVAHPVTRHASNKDEPPRLVSGIRKAVICS